MDNISKNRRYFLLERYAIGASLAAAISLALLLPIGFIDMLGRPYFLVWTVHIASQLAAVGCAAALLICFAAALGNKARAFYGLLFLVPVGIITLQGLLPIISRDALIYHLAVPKLWLRAGQVGEIPWHEWSHFPLALSLGYSGFIELGLTGLTPFYHATYLILVAAVAAAFVHYKYQDEELSLCAALLTMSLPICVKLASEPMADLALAFYFGTTLVLFIVWGEQRGSLKQLVLIGVFLGLALSVKYNSLLAALMLGLCMLSFLQRWDYPFSRILTVMGILFGTAVLVFSPWPLKNYHYTGNPLYPFVGSLFGTSDELPFMGNIKPIEYRLLNYKEEWWQVALIPLRMLFTGQDDSPKQFDGLLSPLLLLSVVPLVYRPAGERRAPWILNTWLFVASFFFISLTLFYALLRYQAPLLVAIVALSAGGLALIGLNRTERQRAIVYRVTMALGTLWLGWYSYGTLKEDAPWLYLQKRESADQYLAKRLTEFSIASYVNRNLPSDAEVYLFYTGNRYFYFDREVRGSYFSHAPVLRWLTESNNPDYLAERFRGEGVTHLAIQNSHTKDALNRSLSDEQKAAWTEFVKRYLKFVAEVETTTIWELKRPEQ